MLPQIPPASFEVLITWDPNAIDTPHLTVNRRYATFYIVWAPVTFERKCADVAYTTPRQFAVDEVVQYLSCT